MIKILTKKKQVAIIKRLIANQFMFTKICPLKDTEVLDKYLTNSTEVIFGIGGFKGLENAIELDKDLRGKTE